ncbi:unnamed protein product, partial [Allacma fusca]
HCNNLDLTRNFQTARPSKQNLTLLFGRHLTSWPGKNRVCQCERDHTRESTPGRTRCK